MRTVIRVRFSSRVQMHFNYVVDLLLLLRNFADQKMFPHVVSKNDATNSHPHNNLLNLHRSNWRKTYLIIVIDQSSRFYSIFTHCVKTVWIYRTVGVFCSWKFRARLRCCLKKCPQIRPKYTAFFEEFDFGSLNLKTKKYAHHLRIDVSSSGKYQHKTTNREAM